MIDQPLVEGADETAVLPRSESLARLPVIAIVGRPNTGKSTLFNRLTRSHRAVVASIPGVTRDRNVAPVTVSGRRVMVADTGGFEDEEQQEIGQAIRRQSLIAADEADAVVVVVDGRAGLNPLDSALVDRLRRLKKPIFLAVNKVDTPRQEDLAGEFHALGLERVFPISAEHGLNVGELFSEVVSELPAPEAVTALDQGATAVAIVGRPNVGKSSLLNRLVGYERSIVSSLPGTTRDAIDTRVVRDGRAYLLVDTAGVRRRPKVQEIVERASVVRALRALEQAEIGLLVIDGTESMTEQDARISSYAWERGRSLILLINKWDAVPVEQRNRKRYAEVANEQYPSLKVVPKLFISARTGAGVERIWGMVDQVAAGHRQHLQTAKLNQVILRATEQQAPPMVRGKRPRFFYATQTATAPPSITTFASGQAEVPAAYQRYLENQLRAAFPLEGTPVRLRFRSRRDAPAPGRRTGGGSTPAPHRKKKTSRPRPAPASKRRRAR